MYVEQVRSEWDSTALELTFAEAITQGDEEEQLAHRNAEQDAPDEDELADNGEVVASVAEDTDVLEPTEEDDVEELVVEDMTMEASMDIATAEEETATEEES